MIARQLEALTGDQARVTLTREKPWASITFAGTRHSFAVQWDSSSGPNAIKNLAEKLPDHEFSIPGYFVADILVTEQSEFQLLIEALSIVDPIDIA
ncbi:hypothetical protein [Sphingorhabdus sp. M41]|uniref:hypothetical protein n=1 Tax=Sphingorhabdus sp. M41 TaxID=1806885 RepID=UPI00078EAB10|nr:hypothetical protein [Sphingorhabdus sp. M41]AMO72815.1 hypothetical protein AZE99_14025 [Sphingorhabdus sp. M41]